MDIKTLIFIISTACFLAGFYYTTEARLETIEREISFLKGQVRVLKVDNKRLNKLIINVKKGKSK